MSVGQRLLDLLKTVPPATIQKYLETVDLDSQRDAPSDTSTFMRWRWKALQEDLGKVSGVNGKLVIHRCMTVPVPETFVRDVTSGAMFGAGKGLGIYWTWNALLAECYWGDPADPSILMSALVDLESVDLQATLKANMHPQTWDENEIRLRHRSPVWVTTLQYDNGTPPIQLRPPVMNMA